MTITAVALEEIPEFDEWVTTQYQLKYSTDGQYWQYVLDHWGNTASFEGIDEDDVTERVTSYLATPVDATFLRLYVSGCLGSGNYHRCGLTWEVYGCRAALVK